MNLNCGLLALQKIKDMKGVSAFTLIHLAKDNDVNLKLFKVREDDLPLVHRPAIFHANNHFEFIKDGEPLPDCKWTGYVLTEKSIGKPISHKIAKKIKGEDPVTITVAIVGAIQATAAAVGTAAVAVGSAAAAAVGTTAAALGSAASAIGGAALLHPVAAGALIGGGVGATTGKVRGLRGAFQGALTGATIGTGVGSFASGFANAGVNAGFAAGTKAGLKAAGTKLLATRGGGALTGATLGNLKTGGSLAGTATGAVIGGTIGGMAGKGLAAASAPLQGPATAAGIAPTTTVGQTLSAGFQGALSGGTAGNLATGANIIGQKLGGSGGFDINRLATAATVAGAANKFGPQAPTGIDFNATKEFSTLRSFLGDQALPAATEKELVTLVNTPLSELTSQLSFQSDRTFKRINDSFDRQAQQLQRQFAQSGQNVRTSSDLRDSLAVLEKNRSEVLGQAQQELANENLTRGIQAKQFALSNSLKKGQFDDSLAFELADVIGTKAALEASIQQNNFNQFQQLMGQILNIGFGSGNAPQQNQTVQQLPNLFQQSNNAPQQNQAVQQQTAGGLLAGGTQFATLPGSTLPGTSGNSLLDNRKFKFAQ